MPIRPLKHPKNALFSQIAPKQIYFWPALFLDRARVPLARSCAVGHALSQTTVPGVAHSFQRSKFPNYHKSKLIYLIIPMYGRNINVSYVYQYVSMDNISMLLYTSLLRQISNMSCIMGSIIDGIVILKKVIASTCIYIMYFKINYSNYK